MFSYLQDVSPCVHNTSPFYVITKGIAPDFSCAMIKHDLEKPLHRETSCRQYDITCIIWDNMIWRDYARYLRQLMKYGPLLRHSSCSSVSIFKISTKQCESLQNGIFWRYMICGYLSPLLHVAFQLLVEVLSCAY